MKSKLNMLTQAATSLDCSTTNSRAYLIATMEHDPKAGKSPTAASNRIITVRGHRIESQDIFVGTREVTISHGEELYRLRLTALNKLILTK
jgi:hemin uptake protein HemP